MLVADLAGTVAREIGEVDDVVSLDEGAGETVSWIHEDTIPDPEGN
mgnify:FL=1